MNIFIDPQTDINYAGFYIQGLYELFGKSNVHFSSDYFKSLKSSFLLRFVLIDDSVILKYVIDFADLSTINEDDYKWCDRYGKINIKKEELANYKKVSSLPPGFGIKIWNNFESLYYGFSNLLKVKNHTLSVKKFLGKYYKLSKQSPISDYRPVSINCKLIYIYHLSTLWQSNEWINNDLGVNLYRSNFMDACKQLTTIEFDGGFVRSNIKNSNPDFQKHLIDAPFVSKNEYLQKINKSFIVFNTPAWASCHGWKLGEYLALGKAIISMPLINTLPYPLEHGKHIHIVSGKTDDIKAAIEKIINDTEYRYYLEKNAYEYFQQYIAPSQTLKLLFLGI